VSGRSIYQHGPAARFFPPDLPLSGDVLAYLARLDELRVLHKRMQVVGEADGVDDGIEHFALFRACMVAASDARDIVQRMMCNAGFREAMQKRPQRMRDFSSAFDEMENVKGAFKRARNKTAAHIDPREMRRALRRSGGDSTGFLVFGAGLGDCRFDHAHVILGSIYARDGKGFVASDSEAVSLVRQCSVAVEAIYKMAFPILRTFDDITSTLFSPK
jgi:hypothetical protein